MTDAYFCNTVVLQFSLFLLFLAFCNHLVMKVTLLLRSQSVIRQQIPTVKLIQATLNFLCLRRDTLVESSLL